MKIELTDRYSALGIPQPDPETVCKGQCEGTGWVPLCNRYYMVDARKCVPADGMTAEEYDLWMAAHIASGEHECDSWHFVKCPACNGTGKRF